MKREKKTCQTIPQLPTCHRVLHQCLPIAASRDAVMLFSSADFQLVSIYSGAQCCCHYSGAQCTGAAQLRFMYRTATNKATTTVTATCSHCHRRAALGHTVLTQCSAAGGRRKEKGENCACHWAPQHVKRNAVVSAGKQRNAASGMGSQSKPAATRQP